jgi:CRISPR-associated endonuclease/helicase Cas3
MASVFQCYAHTREDSEEKQLLQDHLLQSAKRAAEFGKPFQGDDAAFIAALYHDIGKSSRAFQQRLLGNTHSVDHSTAGAQEVYEKYNPWGLLLAYTIAGHHGGLMDYLAAGKSSLHERLNKHIQADKDDTYRAVKDWIDHLEIPELDPPRFFSRLQKRDHATKSDINYSLMFFTRMIFSCLVDADFLDTEAFMDIGRVIQRTIVSDIEMLQTGFLHNMKKLREKSNTKVNKIRNRVFDSCIEAAYNKPGFFSLTVPTGGGKTLSSMGFSLEHARLFKKRRIIYALPYTSIIEQNADVFRKFLGDEAVVEHHSNLDPIRETTRNRLQSENWDAPIIVTTNVQLFESMHSRKSSQNRRLHNIAESIIVLDEAQMLPATLLEPILKCLSTLKEDYGCTIVFCTATQPALNKSSFFSIGLENVREIVPDPKALSLSLQRVDAQLIDTPLSLEELAKRMLMEPQTLCIVNTKKDAKKIFQLLSKLDPHTSFHLSTNMCPVHRSRTIQKIKKRLNDGMECRVVSTQLIEAGVDIDFPVVYRALSGLDSLAQAAGRCNREGRLDKGRIYIFKTENELQPGQLKRSAESGAKVLSQHDHDILSLDANHEYFVDFYQKESRLTSKQGIGFDRKGVMKCVGTNEGEFYFQSMASAFRFIETDTIGVIISWERDWLDALKEYKYLGFFPKEIRRALQQHTVNLYRQQFNTLNEEANIVDFFEDGQYLFLDTDELSQKRYDQYLGIVFEQSYEDIDTLIV